jgi:acyl-coenzyme A synthetase/AMP-(fatty) acid ligase
VPARFNFTRDVVEPLAKGHGRAALTFVDREGIVDRRSFGEIAGDAARWAHLMRTRLDRGDRVMIMTGKVPAWHGAMLGALKGGLIAVPCSELLRARDLAFRVGHSGAKLLVADRSCEVEVQEMLEQLDTPVPVLYLDEARSELARYVPRAPTEDTTAGERALILYTSGTAKEPRGVVHTHAYTWALHSQAEHWLGAHEQDVVWCTAGTGWAKSIWNVLVGPWSCGSEVVLHQGAFDPEDRLGLMQRLGVTVLCQSPTEYRMLAKLDGLASAHLPRLRHAVSAGEPLNPEVIERFQDALGITVHDGYGQTENSLLIANAPGIEVRPGSMGLPTPGHDIAIIDDHAQVCGPGVEGDIALFGKPPTLFAGYWEARDETEAVFRDGWYITGDRGVSDDEGYLWFVGRADDVILSSAYRIGPFEVESALLEHPAVTESAVVGAPDADRGEIVKAFVVLRQGVDPTADLITELQEHVKNVTAPYKYPREVAFVDELPKTTSGKIVRAELRRQPETGYPEPRSLVIPLPVDEAERERSETEAAEEAREAARESARREAAAAAQRAAADAARRDAEEAVRLHDEAVRRATAEATRQQAVEAARREAEEAARFEAEEATRLAAEEQIRRDAEEAARLAAEAAALREAEAVAQREAEEAARAAAEAAAVREAEEAARLAAEEQARQEAEEAARLAAEEQARREADAARAEAEAAAQREAEEVARREETARLEAETQARREAEEAERLAAEQQARLAAADEAQRQAAEERERAAAEALARIEAAEREAAEGEADGEAALVAAAAAGDKLGRRERRALEKQQKELEKQKAKNEAERKKRAEIEARERAKAEAEQRKRDEIEAKERAKLEGEQRKRDEIEARERAKLEAEQRKRDEKAAAEEAKRLEQEERQRQKDLAKLAKGKGFGLGRLLARDEDEFDEDDTPVNPIENIVERLQPYARQGDPVTPVPAAAPEEQDATDDAQGSSDDTA